MIDINNAASTSQTAIGCFLFFRNFRPAKIIHLASGLRGDRRDDLIRTNVEGTAALLDAIGRAGNFSPTFVLCSSGGVYGNPVSLPLSETASCEPLDEYSKTKLAAELVTRSSAAQQGFRLIVARIFNIVGAGGRTSVMLPDRSLFSLPDRAFPVIGFCV